MGPFVTASFARLYINGFPQNVCFLWTSIVTNESMGLQLESCYNLLGIEPFYLTF